MKISDLFSEGKLVFKLGAPLILLWAADIGFGTVGLFFAGAISALDQAAFGLSFTLFITTCVFSIATLNAIITISARLDGAQESLAIGNLGRVGLVLASIFSVLSIALVLLLQCNLGLLELEPKLATRVTEFLGVLVFAIPFQNFATVFLSLSNGLGRTTLPGIIGISSLLVMIIATYCLSFGAFGLPRLDGIGIAVAIVLATIFRCLMSCGLVLQSKFRETKIIEFKFRDPVKTAVHLLKVGSPLGLMELSSMGAVAMISLLVASEGTFFLAAHNIGFNVIVLSHFLIVGLGQGLTIRTGNLLGQEDSSRMNPMYGAAVLFALIFFLISAGCLFLFREEIVMFYSVDSEVISIGSNLLLIAILIKLVDDPAGALTGILIGRKDTRAVFFIRCAAFWVLGIPLGFALLSEFGLYGFWFAVVLTHCLILGATIWRVFFSKNSVRETA